MMASKLPVPNSNSDTFIVAPMDETVVLNKPSTTAVVSVTPARATIPSESYQMTPHGTDKVCSINVVRTTAHGRILKLFHRLFRLINRRQITTILTIYHLVMKLMTTKDLEKQFRAGPIGVILSPLYANSTNSKLSPRRCSRYISYYQVPTLLYTINCSL